MKVKGLIFFYLLLYSSFLLFSEDSFPLLGLPKEDPQYLYEYTKYDANIEFFADGFWNLNLSQGLFFPFNSDKTFKPEAPVFSQEVELSLWFLLNNTWYFELDFAESFDKNTIAAGYIGEGFIKHIRIANRNIHFSKSFQPAFLSQDENETPGIFGSFGKNNFYMESFIRLESTINHSKRFIGQKAISNTSLEDYQWIRGQFFNLPSEKLSNQVSGIFVEDKKGSYEFTEYPNASFRILQEDEFIIYPSKSLIFLVEKNEGIIILSFKTSTDITDDFIETELGFFGDDTSGENISFLKRIQNEFLSFSSEENLIDLNDYSFEVESFNDELNNETHIFLPIQVPSFFSPFENASYYFFYNSYANEAYVETKIHEAESLLYYAEVSNDSKLFQFNSLNSHNLFVQVFSYAQDSLHENQFPFAAVNPIIYLEKEIEGMNSMHSISLIEDNKNNTSSYSISEEALIGTIEVFINAIKIKNFTFNKAKSEVYIYETIGDNDIIEIYWKEAETFDNANLNLAIGLEWLFPKTKLVFISSGEMPLWNLHEDKPNSNTKNDIKLENLFLVEYKTQTDDSSFSLENALNFNLRQVNLSGHDQLDELENENDLNNDNDLDNENKLDLNDPYMRYSIANDFYTNYEINFDLKHNDFPLLEQIQISFATNQSYSKNKNNLIDKDFISGFFKISPSIQFFSFEVKNSISYNFNNQREKSFDFEQISFEIFSIPSFYIFKYFSIHEGFLFNPQSKKAFKDTALSIRIPKSIFPLGFYIETKTNANFQNQIAEQKFFSSLGLDIPIKKTNLYIETMLNLNQKKTNDFNLDFSKTYSQAFNLQFSDGQNAISRNEILQWKFIYDIFSIKPELNFNNSISYNDIKNQNDSQTSYMFQIPFRIKNLDIKLKHNRKYNIRENNFFSLSYSNDLEQYFSSLNERRVFFESFIFADLFPHYLNAQSIWEMKPDGLLEKQEFETAYALELKRKLFLTHIDLLIPSSFEFSLTRNIFILNENQNKDNLYYATKTSFTAFNSFGLFGSKKIFSWFEQDELFSFVQCKINQNLKTQKLNYSIQYFEQVQILITNKNSIFQSFDITFAKESLILYTSLSWHRNGKNSILKPLVESFTKNKEELGLYRKTSLSYSLEKNIHSINTLYANHDLEIKVNKNLSLFSKMNASMVFDEKKMNSIKLEAIISAKLIF